MEESSFYSLCYLFFLLRNELATGMESTVSAMTTAKTAPAQLNGDQFESIASAIVTDDLPVITLIVSPQHRRCQRYRNDRVLTHIAPSI